MELSADGNGLICWARDLLLVMHLDDTLAFHVTALSAVSDLSCSHDGIVVVCRLDDIDASIDSQGEAYTHIAL